MPAYEWQMSTPGAEGIDGALLAGLDGQFERRKWGNIDSMLVIKNDKIVYDRTYEHDYEAINRGQDGSYRYYDADVFPFYKKGALHTLQSITKSMTSAVFGIAVERGDLPGVNREIMDFFDAYEVLYNDARKQRITLEHVLTMTAGIQWDESSMPYHAPDNACRQMEESEDWVKFAINRPMAFDPGVHFQYSSGLSMLLSHIFHKSTGVTIDEYAAKHFFSALDISEFFWQKTPTGLPDTEGGLYLKPHDLARIGLLYLKNGMWGNRQVLPEKWVRMSVTPSVEHTGAYGNETRDRAYGYQWWLVPYRNRPPSYAYTGLGYGGQRLYVVPEYNLVAVFTGWNIYETEALHIRVFHEYILEAVTRQN